MNQAHLTPTANDFDNEALDWLVRSNDGLSAQEHVALAHWLAADSRHLAAFTRWQQDWQTLDTATDDDISLLKQRLAVDIAAESTHAATIKTTPISWWQRLTARVMPRKAFAAALLTVCGTSVVIWYQLHHYAFDHTYVTAQGQQVDVVLPDDSHLWLDTVTQASVSLRRDHRQVVMPAGQMVFHVKGDTARPFDVLAGNTRITVVGTRFSVRYTPDMPGNNQVQVAVEEGRVRVAPTDRPANAIELTVGQMVSVDHTGTPGKVQTVADSEIGLWRQQRVSFDNIALSQALAEFNRYAPARLIITDPQVGAMRITGTFDPTNLDNFTRTLPRVLPVTVQQQQGQAVIMRR